MSALRDAEGWVVPAHKAPSPIVWKTKSHDPVMRRTQVGAYTRPHVSKPCVIYVRDALSPRPNVANVFEEMASQWKRETYFVSSVQQKVLHPAYQRIIGLGRDVVPLVIADLVESKADWFWALRSITGEDPVPESCRGDQSKMVEHWQNWAMSNGYC